MRSGVPGDDRDRHPGQNAAETGVGGVEIAVGVEPDHAEACIADELLQSGDNADRGGVVTSEHKHAGTGSQCPRYETGGARTEFADVDRGSPFFTVRVGERGCLNWSELVACFAESIDQAGGEQGGRTEAESFVRLVVTIGNRNRLDLHLAFHPTMPEPGS